MIPSWERVGRVDLIVRQSPGADDMSALSELKWCGPGFDLVYEAVYDLFKMALGTLRDEGPRAYLLTGAEKALWARSPFADLFEDRQHDPVELCTRTLTDKKQTIAWDDLLRGSNDSFPDTLPSSIETRICGRAGLGDWELRAVEVTVADANPIPMDWGWPSGNRPAAAKHPVLAPASRFVDTAEDIQIDPATLPENIELMRKLDEYAPKEDQAVD